MVKKTDEGLVLNVQAKQALNHMLEDMMVFINAIKVNENLQKLNAAFIEQLEQIAAQCTEMRAKVTRGVDIAPQDLLTLSNDLNKAQDKLHTYKFEDKNAKMLKNLGHALPGAKKIDELPAQKQMSEMQENIKHIVERIQKNAEVIRSNAAPKHRSLWERFTRACVNFANTCKDKILSLFGKKKQEATPAKPQSFQDAHMEAIKKDPNKRQYAMAAAAAAAQAKRTEEAKAKKAEEAHTPPQRPERPARPPRKN